MTSEQLALRFLQLIPTNLQSHVSDWYFKENKEMFFSTPRRNPLTRKEIIKEANQSEIYLAKQEADIRAAGGIRAQTPRYQNRQNPSPSFTPSTNFPPTSTYTPRQVDRTTGKDIDKSGIVCYGCNQPGHYKKDCTHISKTSTGQPQSTPYRPPHLQTGGQRQPQGQFMRDSYGQPKTPNQTDQRQYGLTE